MSYTYKIEYELTERLSDDQLTAMRKVIDLPWTPPPGYGGEVIKRHIVRYYCDSDDCRECEHCRVID